MKVGAEGASIGPYARQQMPGDVEYFKPQTG